MGKPNCKNETSKWWKLWNSSLGNRYILKAFLIKQCLFKNAKKIFIFSVLILTQQKDSDFEEIICERKPKKYFRCGLCKARYRDFVNYTEHRHNRNHFYRCKFCPQKFDRKRTFVSHDNNHLHWQNWNCAQLTDSCGRLFVKTGFWQFFH